MDTIILSVIIVFAVVSLVLLMMLLLTVKNNSGTSDSERRITDATNTASDRMMTMLRNQNELLDRRITALEQSVSTLLRDNASRSDQLKESVENRLQTLRDTLDKRLEGLQQTNEKKIDDMRLSNEKKLEEMRATVDEKLSESLEKRIKNSFSLVSEQLEQVYKGLGEMQSLAAGVGDLKKVLTNVKTRGIWGEIQLAALLEQVLTHDQYAENISVVPNAAERVEFAIILPGREEGKEPVYLPIDSKFPQEDYQRLLDAQESGSPESVTLAAKMLETAIKAQAKTIHDKYIAPPHTTDFAVMFLPVEGLYAEVLRRTGLVERIQRDYRVVITGPTTLAALLNSLQMGFRTLAIEKRSSEVWVLLGNVKSEFSKFSLVLQKTQQKLKQASDTIDEASVRTRVIERKLRRVEELPVANSEEWYDIPASQGETEE
ncbi:MAG: DNA recombination protein RmuC [Bacillota bacterium]|nr:DNA recombination protein RmuC [Bacillota bacterium]